MKRSTVLLISVFFAVCMTTLLPASLFGQDIVSVAPKNIKVLLENDKVRVLDLKFEAGFKLPMHTHSGGYVLYAITTTKLKTTLADGKTSEVEFKAGETRWSDPVTHSNEALTDGHVLLVEMKQPAKKKK